jgi:hypothetical protein
MSTAPDGILEAWQYLQAGQVAHAEDCCRQLLDVNRSHAQVWYVLRSRGLSNKPIGCCGSAGAASQIADYSHRAS